MISKKSFKPLIWAFRFGSWLKVLPGYWDPTKGRVVLFQTKPETIKFYTIWKGLAVLNIGIRMGYFLFLFLQITQSRTIQTSEVIFGIFFILVECMATPLHILYFFSHEQLLLYINTMLQQNEALGNTAVHVHTSEKQ